ncbi:SDR family oxidoreductase [Streptomyces sp. XM4193]|uniref:SDR family oxidoreductase n=1 Tax=Streptomyces sp. XM4193 TaxID=2929782 RepID=UPI0024A60BEB|nr:SDR family oxidoreductase [Streptomyces sp. XM4193]
MSRARKRTAGPSGRPLAGRVVAVTGAGRGIGRRVAETLAAAGARVALGDVDFDSARAAAQAIRDAGGSAEGYALDVTAADSLEAFWDGTEERFGPIDVFVNNAGIMWVGHFADEPDTAARRQFDVNVHGVLSGTRLAARRMRPRGGGHIVTVASAASRLSPRGEATYAATKHAVYGFSVAARAELRGSGVEISLVMPGVVDTELAIGTSQGATRRLSTDDVAAAVLRVVRRPRPETFVPRHLALVPTVAAVLPARVRAGLLRAVVPNQLADGDPAVRADYESRTSGSRSGAAEGPQR